MSAFNLCPRIVCSAPRQLRKPLTTSKLSNRLSGRPLLRHLAMASSASPAGPSPPLPKHLNIVALECYYTPPPAINLPPHHTFTLTEHASTKPHQVAERIRDADVVITTIVKIGAAELAAAASPNVRLITVMASGTDSIDLAACRARGIRVCNSPDCNVDAVSEHALALYFALRRCLVPTMHQLRAGRWRSQGSLMDTAFPQAQRPWGCHQEVAAIIGYGSVGRKIEALLKGLGMKVVIVGRKGASGPPPAGRVSFDDALRTATVVVVCCPRTPETEGMFSDAEFATMRPDAALINVARGGIVDEGAVVRALKDGQIWGTAVDVYGIEPAGPETTPLADPALEGHNLVLTAHTAWLGAETLTNYQKATADNITDFVTGNTNPARTKV